MRDFKSGKRKMEQTSNVRPDGRTDERKDTRKNARPGSIPAKRFAKVNDVKLEVRSKEHTSKKFEPREKEELEQLNLIGRNAVMEAIDNGKTIDKILFKKGEIEGTLKVILAKAREAKIITQEVGKGKLDEISNGMNHQGVIAICPAYEYAEVSDMLDKAKAKGEPPFIVILENITDPHNLGAVIRTCEACGAHGVIIPKRRSVGLTAVVSKTSAGAIEHVLVSRVMNITKVIEDLKKQNVWVACADMDGKPMYKYTLTAKNAGIALVIGSEGAGVTRLVKESCDYTISIPTYGKITSLNASVAAGILMYEVVRQRKFL